MTEFQYDDLPAFRGWRTCFQPIPDASAYLAEHLDVASASLFARLMTPELVLERGCVILKDRYSPSTKRQQDWSVEEGRLRRVSTL